VFCWEDHDPSVTALLDSKPLRFKVGDRVSANIDGRWEPGTIIALNYNAGVDLKLVFEKLVAYQVVEA
jgi:hypothetical protein